MKVTEPIKVLLHDNGADVETAWAIPVPGPAGRVLVRLDNIPFLHAKPTYGDVIEVRLSDDQPGWLAWNAGGRAYEDICGSLEEDGGRYTVIVSYTCDDVGKFAAMTAWARSEGELECEGSRGPRGDQPGRLYIAARHALSTEEIMQLLARNPHGFRFELLHPV